MPAGVALVVEMCSNTAYLCRFGMYANVLVGRLWSTLTASVAGRPRRALKAVVALHRLGRGAFCQVGHTRG